METVRLRLAFEQALAESVKKNTGGLKRFWVLLKPQHKTISDLSRYLLDVFDLHNACPEGLLLSMEGFYLPPFESSCVLKDRDIVRVKRKANLGMVELVAADGGGVKFLANEEFEKEAGGYESDDPEEEDSKLEDVMLHVEETPEMKKVSKKRKASEELGSSKKKKKKEIASSAERCAAKGSKSGEEGTLKAKKSSEPNQCSNDHVDASCSPSGDKKVPSRSARRKKAKRQWLKELRRAEKEKEEKHLSGTPNGKASQKKDHKASAHIVEKEEKQSLVTPNEKARKKKNPKTIKEPVEKDTHTSIEEVPDKGNETVQVDDEQPHQNRDKDDEIVPIVIRPGHIRFEPLEKGDADLAVQHHQTLVDTSQWNGMSKKKGQKWGKQNSESWKWNDDGNSSHIRSETWKENVNSSRKPPETRPFEEDTPVCDHIDFDKLSPYARSPKVKVADIIAYRLIQLSSSWTPELSPYLVGKISEFNPQSHKIKLVAVPNYSLVPQNNEDDETMPETCALQEDGSLEMEFSSLLEVRTVKCSTNPAVSAAAGVVVTSTKAQDTPTKSPTEHRTTTDAAKANSWDEISQALSAKKAELSQEQSWSKPEKNSGSNQRTVKPWRGSALGPTIALLRAQNGI
ncbi:COIL [Linum grandiflorum]